MRTLLTISLTFATVLAVAAVADEPAKKGESQAAQAPTTMSTPAQFEPYQMDEKAMGDLMAAIRACGTEQLIAHNAVWVPGDCVANIQTVLLAQEARAADARKAADEKAKKK